MWVQFLATADCLPLSWSFVSATQSIWRTIYPAIRDTDLLFLPCGRLLGPPIAALKRAFPIRLSVTPSIMTACPPWLRELQMTPAPPFEELHGPRAPRTQPSYTEPLAQYIYTRPVRMRFSRGLTTFVPPGPHMESTA